MRASLLYKASAVLLVIFCAGHSLGFANTKNFPTAGPVLLSMQTIRFPAQGFMRSFWDFYIGFGLFVSVFMLFAAATSWQLGTASPATLMELRPLRWTLALAMIANTYLAWRYFFVGAIVFSALTSLCLVGAATAKSAGSRAARPEYS